MKEKLTVQNVSVSFGRLKAVNDLSFVVREGEIMGVIGPNGSGKTTLLNALSGIIKPDEGHILLDGRDISGLSPARRCKLGIGRTYQIPLPFENMTVFENVLVGGVHGARQTQKEARKKTLDILALVGLLDKKDVLAGRLDLLDRKALEVGRALATDPGVLLLDEVAAGLTEAEVEKIIRDVREIRERGVTIVWIEHIIMTMLEGVDRLLCIAHGEHVMLGEPKATMAAPEVQACYLGVDEE